MILLFDEDSSRVRPDSCTPSNQTQHDNIKPVVPRTRRGPICTRKNVINTSLLSLPTDIMKKRIHNVNIKGVYSRKPLQRNFVIKHWDRPGDLVNTSQTFEVHGPENLWDLSRCAFTKTVRQPWLHRTRTGVPRCCPEGPEGPSTCFRLDPCSRSNSPVFIPRVKCYPYVLFLCLRKSFTDFTTKTYRKIFTDSGTTGYLCPP